MYDLVDVPELLLMFDAQRDEAVKKYGKPLFDGPTGGQFGLLRVGWKRPGGSYFFGPQMDGYFIWAYLSPSHTPGLRATAPKLR